MKTNMSKKKKIARAGPVRFGGGLGVRRPGSGGRKQKPPAMRWSRSRSPGMTRSWGLSYMP